MVDFTDCYINGRWTYPEFQRLFSSIQQLGYQPNFGNRYIVVRLYHGKDSPQEFQQLVNRLTARLDIADGKCSTASGIDFTALGRNGIDDPKTFIGE